MHQHTTAFHIGLLTLKIEAKKKLRNITILCILRTGKITSSKHTGLTQVPGEERQACLPGEPCDSSFTFCH